MHSKLFDPTSGTSALAGEPHAIRVSFSTGPPPPQKKKGGFLSLSLVNCQKGVPFKQDTPWACLNYGLGKVTPIGLRTAGGSHLGVPRPWPHGCSKHLDQAPEMDGPNGARPERADTRQETETHVKDATFAGGRRLHNVPTRLFHHSQIQTGLHPGIFLDRALAHDQQGRCGVAACVLRSALELRTWSMKSMRPSAVISQACGSEQDLDEFSSILVLQVFCWGFCTMFIRYRRSSSCMVAFVLASLKVVPEQWAHCLACRSLSWKPRVGEMGNAQNGNTPPEKKKKN